MTTLNLVKDESIMLSIKPISSASSAHHYYTAKDNYYLKDKDSLNQWSLWLGKGAERLGLGDTVESNQFLKLLDGVLPSGQELGIIQNGKRLHRSGTDLTFSAPKSVSILALMGDDERLIHAHQKAVHVAFERVEALASEARITFNKETTFQKTKNLVAASFLHTTSRELDPDLHTHVPILNMTERADEQWRALSSRDKRDKEHLEHGFRELIYDNQHYFGMIYNATLAKEAKSLGYGIRITDRYGNFELIGVSDELIDAFSKRRKNIQADMLEKGYSSAKAAEKSNLATRKEKAETDSKALLVQWRDEAKPFGIDLEQLVVHSKTANKEGSAFLGESLKPQSHNAKEAVQDALEHLSIFSTQIKHSSLVRQAMSFSASLLSHEDIEQEISTRLEKQFLHGKPFEYYTTAELLAQEKEFVKKMSASSELSQTLNSTGKDVVAQVLSKTSRIQIIDVHGLHTERQLVQDLVSTAELNHCNAYVVHQGRTQAQQLRSDLTHEQQSPFSWLKNLVRDELVHTVAGFTYHYGAQLGTSWMTKNKQDVVIVHDAQKLSYKELETLNELSVAHQSKLVLLNNTESTQGFRAGNPLKILNDNGIHSIDSGTIKKTAEVALTITPNSTDKMMNEWVTQYRDKKPTLLAFSSTQREELNVKAREALKNEGMLSHQQTTITTLSPVNLTAIEARKGMLYQKGDKITFGAFTSKQTQYECIEKSKDGLYLKDKKENTIFQPFHQLNEVHVARPVELELCIGEQLTNETPIFWNRKKWAQGSAFVVSHFNEHKVTLQCDKNKIILTREELANLSLTYSYAKKTHQLTKKDSELWISSEPHQLNKNKLGELSDYAKKIHLFTYNEERAQKFLQKEQIKWTAKDVYENKPDLIYRDSGNAQDSFNKDLNFLVQSLQVPDKNQVAQQAVSYAVAKCAERNAAFRHSDLLVHALKHAIGDIDFHDVYPILKKQMTQGNLVHLDTFWTTKEAVQLEQEILNLNRAEQNKVRPIESDRTRLLSLSQQLTKGQREAITLVTTTSDRFVSIQGLAGVGKTTLFREVDRIASEHHYTPLGLAPTHKAVAEMKANGINAQTVAGFLAQDRTINAQTLLLVDESSMIDNHSYHLLQKKAIAADSRIVFTGDMTQILSLSSGIPHELTIKSRTQKTVHMNEIVRQNPNLQLKKAAQYAAKRRIKEGTEALEAIQPKAYVERRTENREADYSSVIEVPCDIDDKGRKSYKSIYEAVAKDYLTRTTSCQKETMVIVHAHQDRKVVDNLIRRGLQQQGQLDTNESKQVRLVAKSIDKADQLFASQYQKGDVLCFGKSYYIAEKGEYFVIQDIDLEKNRLICTNRQDKNFSIKAELLEKAQISLYGQDQCPLADGDRIRIKKTNEPLGLVANDEYTIKSIKGSQALIHNDQQELTLNLDERSGQHWDYAYTNTAFSSQGATSKLVIFLELLERIKVTTHRSHLIDMTRAKYQATMYTDDKKGLIERLEDPLKQRDADKKSAWFAVLEHETQNKKTQAISLKIQEQTQKQDVLSKKEEESGIGNKYPKNLQADKRTFIDAQKLLEDLNQRAEPLVKRLLGEPNRKLSSAAEYRYGSKGSLKINMNKGLWHNFETGESGNLFSLIKNELMYTDFKDILRYAQQFSGYTELEVHAPKNKESATKEQEPNRGSIKKAVDLYQKSIPIQGSLVEKYLRVHRGLHHFEHADLRCCPSVATIRNEVKAYTPALLAIAKDEQGSLHHVQITRLNSERGEKDKLSNLVKQTYGSNGSCSVNLNRQGTSDITYFTEGVETGLSILEVDNTAKVRAVLGKQNFKKINPNDATKKVVLCVDNDGDATYSINKSTQSNTIVDAAERLTQLGFDVMINLPNKKGEDLNDILLKIGKKGLERQLNKHLSISEFKVQVQDKNKQPQKIDVLEYPSINLPSITLKTIEPARLKMDRMTIDAARHIKLTQHEQKRETPNIANREREF